MDKQEMQQFMKEKYDQIEINSKRILKITDMIIGDEIEDICYVIENLPNSIMSKQILSSTILSIAEAGCNNSDEIISLLDECKEAMIQIETEFNKS